MFVKLKDNQDFQLVYSQGKSKANRYLVMYVRKREDGPNRYGFSVSKKVGNSVVRHHITRLLREVIRKDDEHIKNGNDIVIIVRQAAKGKSLKEIDGAVYHLLKLHGINI
mgnify:CR=1 FL=1